MTMDELIQTVRGATPDELARLRVLLKVPDATYHRTDEAPRNMGDLWNRQDGAVHDSSTRR